MGNVEVAYIEIFFYMFSYVSLIALSTITKNRFCHLRASA